MEPTVAGIDVSEDRLVVAVRPSGEAFSVPRDAAGLDAFPARLAPLAPAAVAVEATGGFEAVVAAGGRGQWSRPPSAPQACRSSW